MSKSKTAIFLLALAMSVAELSALINPNFTPVHLVESSSRITTLDLYKVTSGSVKAKVVINHKGKASKKKFKIDLTKSSFPEQAKAIRKMIRGSENTLALLFVANEGDGDKAYLHYNQSWLVLTRDGKNWAYCESSESMVGTWNGSTDMLERAVELFIRQPDSNMPSKIEKVWQSIHQLPIVPREDVSDIHSVNLGSGKVLHLHFPSISGDQLLRVAEGKVVDVTKELGLKTMSKHAAWGDFDRDGLLDLVSARGVELTLFTQKTSGAFVFVKKIELPKACRDLELITCAKGEAGLIVAVSGAHPLIVKIGRQSNEIQFLSSSEWTRRSQGEVSCKVADFDSDGLNDVLLFSDAKGLLYRARAEGKFAEAQNCGISLDSPASRICVGDFDADGWLDVVSSGSQRLNVWHNRGRGKFSEEFSGTGELSYVSKKDSIGVATGEINGDGRQDLLITYADKAPQLFFNRGFRSFGYSNALSQGCGKLLSDKGVTDMGQQIARLVDMDGDRAQDLVVILKDGRAYWLKRSGDRKELALRVRLAEKFSGPVKVTAKESERSLGARLAVSGDSEVIFAIEESGPIVVSWQYPGGQVRESEVILEDEPQSLVLNP